MSTCKNCGAIVPADAKFCTSCGAAMETPVAEETVTLDDAVKNAQESFTSEAPKADFFNDTADKVGEFIDHAEDKVGDVIDQVENKINAAPSSSIPGKNAAIASLVLGIISVVCCFFGYSAILSLILGIIGLVCASNSKKAGFENGMRTAGFVLSLIGLVGGALAFVACSCLGCIGCSIANS